MNSFDEAKACKMEFLIDSNNNELLLRDGEYQVMMEWEKPYMKACIDELSPTNKDVLEIGFGCGYSAEQIQKYSPRSHTIIECHSGVINYGQFEKGFHPTLGKYSNVKWVEGTWQETLHNLGHFDVLFFDDYPLLPESQNITEIRLSQQRLFMFLDICLDWHMKPGSQLSAYISSPEITQASSWKNQIVNNPKIIYTEKIIEVSVPENCDYFKGNKAVIPIIQKK
tara:strand:- start:1570 stop:2244 length:675 start_codon:yes stop_codon:yes gene_type:complete